MMFGSLELNSSLNTKEEEEVKTEASQSQVPKNPKQNLESKIESLINSIKNLSEKKLRIEFELKRQKKALARKREALKRETKSSQVKAKISLESEQSPTPEEKLIDDQKRTQRLLQESARILEE